VKVIVDHLGPTSALHRALTGSSWLVTDYLLADVVDAERMALWQRSNEGAKNPTSKPDPYPRPGQVVMSKAEKARARAAAEKKRKGTG